MKPKDIIDAWAEIRKTNQSIPDEVLDYMKDSALTKLNEYENEKEINIFITGKINTFKSTVLYIIKKNLTSLGFDVTHSDIYYEHHNKNYFDETFKNKVDAIGYEHLTSKVKINLVEQTIKQTNK